MYHSPPHLPVGCDALSPTPALYRSSARSVLADAARDDAIHTRDAEGLSGWHALARKPCITGRHPMWHR